MESLMPIEDDDRDSRGRRKKRTLKTKLEKAKYRNTCSWSVPWSKLIESIRIMRSLEKICA